MPEEPIHPAMQQLLGRIADRLSVRDKPGGFGSRLKRSLETNDDRTMAIDKEAIERSHKLAEQLRKENPEAFE